MHALPCLFAQAVQSLHFMMVALVAELHMHALHDKCNCHHHHVTQSSHSINAIGPQM
jgi:hypothetical protein